MNYTYNMIIVVTALAVISLLVHENSRLHKIEKRRFYLTYIVMAVALISEWLGLYLNGMESWTIPLHKLAKALDYISAPLAGLMLINQLTSKSWTNRIAGRIILFNTVFEIASIFTGWTFYIDADNCYYHGPLYFVYMHVYVWIIILVLAGFVIYGNKYPKHNRGSLFAIIALMGIGIAIQEITGFRSYCICLVLAALLLFIHYSEFNQLTNDFRIEYQRELLQKDVLSKLYSRYAYTQELEVLKKMHELPDNLVVFSVDVNGLKTVNDSLGHMAGDELIRGASACIEEVLGPYGKCYRTGGDEFMAFLYVDESVVSVLDQALQDKAAKWTGVSVPSLSMSSGYCIRANHPQLSLEQMIIVADNEMYAAKERYYKMSGRSRR